VEELDRLVAWKPRDIVRVKIGRMVPVTFGRVRYDEIYVISPMQALAT
jgi:hypothetical protein